MRRGWKIALSALAALAVAVPTGLVILVQWSVHREAQLEQATRAIAADIDSYFEDGHPGTSSRHGRTPRPQLYYTGWPTPENSLDFNRHWDTFGYTQFSDPTGKQASIVAGGLQQHLRDQRWKCRHDETNGPDFCFLDDSLGSWSVTIDHRTSQDGFAIIQYSLSSPSVRSW